MIQIVFINNQNSRQTLDLNHRIWAGLSFADVHAAKLTLPRIESVAADTVFAAEISGLDAALVLLEDADNLLFCELLLHANLLLFFQRILALFWHTFRGLCQCDWPMPLNPVSPS